MKKTILWIITAVVVIGGGIILVNRPVDEPSDAASTDVVQTNGTVSESADTDTDADTDANNDASAPAGSDGASGDSTVAPSGPQSVTVTHTAGGFSPSVVTIRVGDTVRFVNESGGSLWVASAQHPTHTVYAGTSLAEHCGNAADNDAFDQCSTGNDYSFTFGKAGEWKYHNHVNASQTGTVVVQ